MIINVTKMIQAFIFLNLRILEWNRRCGLSPPYHLLNKNCVNLEEGEYAYSSSAAQFSRRFIGPCRPTVCEVEQKLSLGHHGRELFHFFWNLQQITGVGTRERIVKPATQFGTNSFSRSIKCDWKIDPCCWLVYSVLFTTTVLHLIN